MNELDILDIGSAFAAYMLTKQKVTRLVGSGDQARIYSQFIPQKMPETESALTFRVTSNYPLQHLTGVSQQSDGRLRVKAYGKNRQTAVYLSEMVRTILLLNSGVADWGPIHIFGVTLEFGPIDDADLPRDGGDIHRPNIVCDYSVSWTQRTESM